MERCERGRQSEHVNERESGRASGLNVERRSLDSRILRITNCRPARMPRSSFQGPEAQAVNTL